MKQSVKKKKGRWILPAILAALAIVISALLWWQRGNLEAIRAAEQYSSEELEGRMQENRMEMEQAISKQEGITVRDLDESEKQALQDGTISSEELVSRLVDAASDAAPASDVSLTKQTAADPGDAASSAPPEKSAYQDGLSRIIARAYIMRQEYNNMLDGMVAQAKQEYSAKPDSERTRTKLVKWASGYVRRVTELEKECDARMDALAVEMSVLIRENGGDESLVDEVLGAYAKEKSLKKAWYINEMEKRGLL